MTFKKRQEQAVLSALESHPWRRVYSEHHILATAQVDADIATALMKDLWLLIPAIIATILFALLLAFGHWRALLLPVFTSLAWPLVFIRRE